MSQTNANPAENEKNLASPHVLSLNPLNSHPSNTALVELIDNDKDSPLLADTQLLSRVLITVVEQQTSEPVKWRRPPKDYSSHFANAQPSTAQESHSGLWLICASV